MTFPKTINLMTQILINKLIRLHSSFLFLLLILMSTTQIGFCAENDNPLTNKNDSKGLFTIQFSWNNESFSKNTTVEIIYQRKSLLGKAKSSSEQLFARRNTFINLELREGEYEFVALHLKGKEFGYNKYLEVPFEESFVIKAGKITNGGLIFLTRENTSTMKILTLKLDNNPDIQQYVSTYKTGYTAEADSIEPAWNFIENSQVDEMVKAYAKTLVDRYKANEKKSVIYTYATLGIVIKMARNESGDITGYQLIDTPSYQHIESMKLHNNKLICILANGSYLYGDDNGLSFMPMPQGLETIPTLYIVDNNYLLIDYNFNIFSADEYFGWMSQLEFNNRKSDMGKFLSETSYPVFYEGKKNIYIYSKATGKQKILLRSSRDKIHFESIALSDVVRQITMVTETDSKLILGPDLKLNATAKRPAYLYIKDHNSDLWEVRDLPRGDCNKFAPGKDQTIFYTECSKDNWFESHDFGKTWSKWQAGK